MSVIRKQPTDLPKFITLRTDALAPLLMKWREENPDVPWSRLIKRGLSHELKPYAGKREQHLLAA
jgi:hypothetical protein